MSESGRYANNFIRQTWELYLASRPDRHIDIDSSEKTLLVDNGEIVKLLRMIGILTAFKCGWNVNINVPTCELRHFTYSLDDHAISYLIICISCSLVFVPFDFMTNLKVLFCLSGNASCFLFILFDSNYIICRIYVYTVVLKRPSSFSLHSPLFPSTCAHIHSITLMSQW